MEKLELEYIAPYLPYKVRFDNGRDYEKDYLLGIRVNSYNVPIAQGSREYDYFRLENIKLCLRPLSDLTKEIEHNGEKFYPYEKLHLCYSDVINFLNEDLWIGQWFNYEQVTKLLELHFDISGLIEKDLAIDINTIDL